VPEGRGSLYKNKTLNIKFLNSDIMIQRKQTIYLFFAGLVTLVLLFIPFADVYTDIAGFKYTAFSVRDITPDKTFILSTIGNALLLIATSALSFITIFMYKNRRLQLQLISLNMMVILVTIFTILYVYPHFVFPKSQDLVGAEVKYNPVIIISLVSAIGIYFAKKAIAKDEAMVRSAERLR
jgi:hypothetical protein